MILLPRSYANQEFGPPQPLTLTFLVPYISKVHYLLYFMLTIWYTITVGFTNYSYFHKPHPVFCNSRVRFFPFLVLTLFYPIKVWLDILLI